MDEDRVGPNVEDGVEKKEEDANDMKVSVKDVNGANDEKKEDRTKKTK